MSVFVSIGAKLLPSLNSTQNSVVRSFEQMNRKLRVQAAETKLAFKEMQAAMTPLAAMAAVGGLTMGVKGILGHAAEYQHEITQMKNMGRTSKEMSEAIRQSWKTINEIPTSTLSDNLKVLNETTMAFGGFAHAAENLSFVQKMSGMLQNVLGDEHGLTKDSAYSLIKALEMRGMGTKAHPGFDKMRFQSEAGQLYQASIASGGKVTPEEFFNFTKKSSPYTSGFSDRFMYRIAPTLIQEQGGEIAGTQVNTFLGTILGKSKNKLQTEAWMKLGMLDPKQVVYNKVGPVGWQPGAIKGTDVALRDPMQFMENLGKVLQARGTDLSNSLSLTKALMPLFRDRNAFRMAYNLLYQQSNTNLHKDERLINKVPTLGAAYNNSMRNDPQMQLKALSSSLQNLETAMGSAFFKGGGVAAINSIANAFNWLAGAFDRHPNFAKAVTGLMAFGAVVATLKVFRFALGWVFSPLKSLWRLMFSSVGAAGPRVPWITRIGSGLKWLWSGLARLGPMLLRGFMALAPIVLEGLGTLFALISNPIGWTIMAAAVAGIIIYAFRDAIGKWWNTTVVPAWNTYAQPAIDSLIDGFSAQWGRFASWFTSQWNSLVPKFMQIDVTPVVHGRPGDTISNIGAQWAAPAIPPRGNAIPHRALGGSISARRPYLVGERGPEIVFPGRSGTVATNERTARILAQRSGGGNTYNVTVNASGQQDASAIARAVRAELQRMALEPAGYLSD